MSETGAPARAWSFGTGSPAESHGRVLDRYGIVSEADLRQGAIRQAEHVAHQAPAPTVVPLPRTSDPELELGHSSDRKTRGGPRRPPRLPGKDGEP